MSVSAILFLIFVFLKPLYLFPSGGLGVGDGSGFSKRNDTQV